MNFEKIEKELAKSGMAERIKAMADSEEAKRLSAMLDVDAVGKAAKSSDSDALMGILDQLLGTQEGRKLAQQISDAMK